MNGKKWFAVAALASLGVVAPARAQMGMGRMPGLEGIFRPVVGAGAAYSVESKGKKHEMEVAIVGKESVQGKDAYWMEFGMDSPEGGGKMYTKMLTTVSADNIVTERMIFQMPGKPPMEMSMQISRMGNGNQKLADARKEMERVGTETITTPAGTFSCEHWRKKDGSTDVWLSEKVAPWGLVQMVSKDSTMTLERVLTDAKSKITGTPVKFNPMEMMRQPRDPN
jgi:hypothetical protein